MSDATEVREDRTEKRPVDLCVARPLEPTEDPFRRVEGADLGLEVKVW